MGKRPLYVGWGVQTLSLFVLKPVSYPAFSLHAGHTCQRPNIPQWVIKLSVHDYDRRLGGSGYRGGSVRI